MNTAYGNVGAEFADDTYDGPYPPGHPCWRAPEDRPEFYEKKAEPEQRIVEWK
jgi:hypothetical protein